jgi:hypothetical protein
VSASAWRRHFRGVESSALLRHNGDVVDAPFAIAVKRERRADVPRDWVDRVRRIKGVTIVGDAQSTRLQIRATAAAIQAVGRELAEFVHIEPLIRHDRT